MARTDDDHWDITESVGATAHKPELPRDDHSPDSLFVEGRRRTGP